MSLSIIILLCLIETNILRKLFIVITSLILYGNIIAVGTDIDALAQGNKSMETIVGSVISSMIDEGVYSPDKKYAFIGNTSENTLFYKNELWDKASSYAKAGCIQTYPDTLIDSYSGVLNNIGFQLKFPDYEEYKNIMKEDSTKRMPIYPEKGSIIEKNDVVIVKISDDYQDMNNK